jgi:predicted dehydrogenase
VRVLDGEAAPDPTGIDGQQALRLAEAAYVALQTGRRVEL